MNISATTDSILRALEKYSLFLDSIDEEQFQVSPAEGIWSWSEVYSHIITADTGCLIAIERCMNKEKSKFGRIQLRTWLILFFGAFPPVKLKAPEKVAAMVKKISIEEARDGIAKLRQRIPEGEALVHQSSSKQKLKHPRLGLLNARQWLRFIEIHTIHHLKQLERIKLMLTNH